MVGTAMNNVRFPCAMRSHVSLASNVGVMSQRAPLDNAQPSTFTMPCT